MSDPARRHGAGDAIDDLCRVCKEIRAHRVIAVSTEGAILRVICGYCGSQHNYRAAVERSERLERSQRAAAGDRGERAVFTRTPGGEAQPRGAPARAGDHELLVSERERTFPKMTEGQPDLEMMLRRIIREEAGLTPVVPAEKWRGGTMVLKPGREGVQEKSIPLESFFHKIVMLRNRLRVMEQQINAAELPDDQKLKLQGYITGCYGTLTTFNVLFAEEDDRFHGSGGD